MISNRKNQGYEAENGLLWERCVQFHGHECGGLTIGYKASLYAIKLLSLERYLGECGGLSSDEEIVCIAENDACGIDAVQVIMGCTIGKGNLLFHMTGKQAFSFYSRERNLSVRLVLKHCPEGMTKKEAFRYYQERKAEELFTVKKVQIPLPDKARIYQSIRCAGCGESAAENKIRMWKGKAYCLDCCTDPDRFSI